MALILCAVYLILLEAGFYTLVVKPVLEPCRLYSVYYMKALLPKKRVKMYHIKRDCHRIDIM